MLPGAEFEWWYNITSSVAQLTSLKSNSAMCREYDYPIAGLWQPDPDCCAKAANAGCHREYVVRWLTQLLCLLLLREGLLVAEIIHDN